MSKLEGLRKLKEEYQKRIREDGEKALKETFVELFDKYPELKSITWAQYTPYFNDGDTCTFSVREFDFGLADDAPEDWKEAMGEYADSDYHYGESIYTARHTSIPKLKELAVDVTQLGRDMPDDLLQYIFGDHCQVVVTRDGMEVLEYEHD